MLKINWYDYGARFYDPQIARFHTLDPLAEMFTKQSPYVYADNNPVRYIDYMGMNAKEKDDEEEEKPDVCYFEASRNMLVDYYRNLGHDVENLDDVQSVVDKMMKEDNGYEGRSDVYPLFKYSGNQTKYPGALIFESPLMPSGSGVAIPPFIFTSPNKAKDKGLMEHEYGHHIQYVQISLVTNPITGYYLYLIGVGLPSLWSAGTDPANHSKFWTERWADFNSKWFFNLWEKQNDN